MQGAAEYHRSRQTDHIKEKEYLPPPCFWAVQPTAAQLEFNNVGIAKPLISHMLLPTAVAPIVQWCDHHHFIINQSAASQTQSWHCSTVLCTQTVARNATASIIQAFVRRTQVALSTRIAYCVLVQQLIAMLNKMKSQDTQAGLIAFVAFCIHLEMALEHSWPL